MAQRVAIARALARKPSILLLDEPFSALDSFTRVKLQDHLGALWEKSRFTLLLVTHDIETAPEFQTIKKEVTRALDLSLATSPLVRETLLREFGRTDCWIKVKNPNAPAVRREAEEGWG